MKRRKFLECLAATGAAVVASPARAALPPAVALDALAADVTGGQPYKPGRVELTIPPLADNGNSVPLRIAVQSPMTEADHVKAIHVIAEKNPRPMVAAFHLGPHSGRAVISTRVRLGGGQRLLVLAQMSDGSWWSGHADVVVTLSACLDET